MARSAFHTDFRVYFHLADPASIMFFGNAYKVAHNTFEEFVVHLGYDYNFWFANKKWAVPLRHTECEHLIPMRVGEIYRVSVFVDRIGKTSVTLRYQFSRKAKLHAQVTLVHAFVDLKGIRPMSIPPKIRADLEAYLAKCPQPLKLP